MPDFIVTTALDLKSVYGVYDGTLTLKRLGSKPEEVELFIEGETLDGQSHYFTVKTADLAAVLEFILQPITPLERK